jgi:hypothetical protein
LSVSKRFGFFNERNSISITVLPSFKLNSCSLGELEKILEVFLFLVRLNKDSEPPSLYSPSIHSSSFHYRTIVAAAADLLSRDLLFGEF